MSADTEPVYEFEFAPSEDPGKVTVTVRNVAVEDEKQVARTVSLMERIRGWRTGKVEFIGSDGSVRRYDVTGTFESGGEQK